MDMHNIPYQYKWLQVCIRRYICCRITEVYFEVISRALCYECLVMSSHKGWRGFVGKRTTWRLLWHCVRTCGIWCTEEPDMWLVTLPANWTSHTALSLCGSISRSWQYRLSPDDTLVAVCVTSACMCRYLTCPTTISCVGNRDEIT